MTYVVSEILSMTYVVSEILSMTYVVLNGYLYDPIDYIKPAIAIGWKRYTKIGAKPAQPAANTGEPPWPGPIWQRHTAGPA
jgi:hypothetical protein